MLELLKQKYPKNVADPNPDSVADVENSLKVNATHQYEKIYDAFIEGRFDEAIAQKKVADSVYGDKYWTRSYSISNPSILSAATRTHRQKQCSKVSSTSSLTPPCQTKLPPCWMSLGAAVRSKTILPDSRSKRRRTPSL